MLADCVSVAKPWNGVRRLLAKHEDQRKPCRARFRARGIEQAHFMAHPWSAGFIAWLSLFTLLLPAGSQSSSSSAPEINSSVIHPHLLVLTQTKEQSRHQPLIP